MIEETLDIQGKWTGTKESVLGKMLRKENTCGLAQVSHYTKNLNGS